jgi:SpoVK/Ycf46/Vps4 family AAA+-type ATPase
MKDKGMPEGITVILHGAPGTGKTETVYQLARATGREIMKVDISRTRSMWFGESERLVKQIFNDYRDFKKSSSVCPVLLFNEADAIISKRLESVQSTAGKTENTLQNILLEELESFNGIFFATTNLVQNLDRAFERRFLFKVSLTLPDISNRAMIWKSKLLHLDLGNCKELASQFIFSGGQIDNIARKCEMAYVISGTMPGLNEIISFCREERLEGNGRQKIGFYS